MAFKLHDKVNVSRDYLEHDRYMSCFAPKTFIGEITKVNDSYEGDKSYLVKFKDGFEKKLYSYAMTLYVPPNIKLTPFSPIEKLVKSKNNIFILEDRLYLLEDKFNTKPTSENYFSKVIDGNRVYINVISSPSLSSLEKLSILENNKEVAKFKDAYLETQLSKLTKPAEKAKVSPRYVLVDFIVNKVFPYFESKSDGASKVADLILDKSERIITGDKKIIKITDSQKLNKEQQKQIEKTIETLAKEVDCEKPTAPKIKDKKSKKLDFLLGFEATKDFTEFPSDYQAQSILGKAFGSRYFAISNGAVHNLLPTTLRYVDAAKQALGGDDSVLVINNKAYEVYGTNSLSNFEENINFELEKALKFDVIKNQLRHKLRALAISKSSIDIENLVKLQSYRKENFGFIRASANRGDNDWGSGAAYYVYLKVPAHVLKLPDDYDMDDEDDDSYSDDYDSYSSHKKNKEPKKKREKFYAFGTVDVGLRVSIDDDNSIYYDDKIVTCQSYSHPFTHYSGETERFGDICMGSYSTHKLDRLDKAQAIAKFLADGRQVLLSGYIDGGVSPRVALHDFKSKRISPSKIKKENYQ